MRFFLLKLAAFVFTLCIVGEIIIRIFRLVPDIPERYIDEYNIQRYKPEQSGYYTKAKTKWNVNKYGWLGTHENIEDRTISIIGDSYIENIMNPIECNQGYILKQHFPNNSFFEAGRSGVTFIEAMEISKILDLEVNPKYHLIYLNENDFYESISEINRFTDRLQISINTQELLPNDIKSPGLKKILYSFKLLYYFYLNYPIFVEKQNKGETSITASENPQFNSLIFNKLLHYCSENYELNKLIFVFHPNTNNSIIELVRNRGIKTILLNSENDESWALGKNDGHWSCYGHNQIGSQVASELNLYLN